jgi:hypothetical protein
LNRVLPMGALPLWVMLMVPLFLALLAFAAGQMWPGAGMLVVLAGSALWVALSVAHGRHAEGAGHAAHIDRLAIATRMIAHYNAQDADAYVSLMTEDACEAGYRGAVVREGREGVRAGLKAMFAEFPQNRAEILTGYALGEFVALHEKVWRTDESEPFEVMSLYSFEGDKVARVEFVR